MRNWVQKQGSETGVRNWGQKQGSETDTKTLQCQFNKKTEICHGHFSETSELPFQNVTFRLLTVLVEGNNSCQYDPHCNESTLHYARDALRLMDIYSGGSVHSVIRSYLNTPLTYLPAHMLREITRSWETRLSPGAVHRIRAEAPPTPVQGDPDQSSDEVPSGPDAPTAAELAALTASLIRDIIPPPPSDLGPLGVAVPPPPGVEPIPAPPGWTTLRTPRSPSSSDVLFARTTLQRLNTSSHGNAQDIAYRLAAVLAHGPKKASWHTNADDAGNLQRGRDALIAAGSSHLGSIYPVLRRWYSLPDVLPTASFSSSPLVMDPPPSHRGAPPVPTRKPLTPCHW